MHVGKLVLFGHSAFGIIALEFAKRYPDTVLGIIMIGTPLNSNAEVAAINNAYFEQHAEPEESILILTARSDCSGRFNQIRLRVLDFYANKYIAILHAIGTFQILIVRNCGKMLF